MLAIDMNVTERVHTKGIAIRPIVEMSVLRRCGSDGLNE